MCRANRAVQRFWSPWIVKKKVDPRPGLGLHPDAIAIPLDDSLANRQPHAADSRSVRSRVNERMHCLLWQTEFTLYQYHRDRFRDSGISRWAVGEVKCV
jgi:hypothetical protein